jgi:hypothetical protein
MTIRMTKHEGGTFIGGAVGAGIGAVAGSFIGDKLGEAVVKDGRPPITN